MLDLKPYHDAVLTADEEVKCVANEIDALFQEGTDESKEQALALRPALDEAQGKYDAALGLYESIKKAAAPSDVAKNFVPVSDTSPIPEGEEPNGVMKRHDFQALSPADREAHIKGGGTVED